MNSGENKEETLMEEAVKEKADSEEPMEEEMSQGREYPGGKDFSREYRVAHKYGVFLSFSHHGKLTFFSNRGDLQSQ